MEFRFYKKYLQVYGPGGSLLYTSPKWDTYSFWGQKEEKFEASNRSLTVFDPWSEYKAAICLGAYEGNKSQVLYVAPKGSTAIFKMQASQFTGSPYQLFVLEGREPDVIRKYLPQAVYLVTRSDMPPKGTKYPWKQVRRKTYLWVVPLEDNEKYKGNRGNVGYGRLFPTRRKALDFLYGQK